MKRDIESIEAQIRQEKAEALGRTGERLEHILAEMADIREAFLGMAVTASTPPGDAEKDRLTGLHQKVEKYAHLLEQARQLRHHLVIQREAVGLRRHEDVDRQYPLPAPLRLSLIIRDRDKELS